MVVTLQYLIYLMRTLSHPPQWFSFALTHRLIKSLDLQFNIWYLISVSSMKEKAMAPHSSTLAWKIPWTEEPGWAAVHGVAKSQTWLSDFTFTFHFHALEKEMATCSSILSGKFRGQRSLVGYNPWGHKEADTTEWLNTHRSSQSTE